MGTSCGAYGGQERWLHGFGGRTDRKKTTWKTCLWIFMKWDWEAWTGFLWLRLWKSGGLLLVLLWTLGFHKLRGIFWLPEEDLLVSQVGLCSTLLFSVYFHCTLCTTCIRMQFYNYVYNCRYTNSFFILFICFHVACMRNEFFRTCSSHVKGWAVLV
jgi:hypothetical protein